MLTLFLALANPLTLTPPLPELVMFMSFVALTLPVEFRLIAPFVLLMLTEFPMLASLEPVALTLPLISIPEPELLIYTLELFTPLTFPLIFR